MSNVQVMTREEEVLENFMSNIWRLSIDELKQARSAIDNQLSLHTHSNLSNIKKQLRPGIRCKVNHPKASGKVFIITKVNRTKVKASVEGSTVMNSITGGSYGNWTIPISMLEIIG